VGYVTATTTLAIAPPCHRLPPSPPASPNSHRQSPKIHDQQTKQRSEGQPAEGPLAFACWSRAQPAEPGESTLASTGARGRHSEPGAKRSRSPGAFWGLSAVAPAGMEHDGGVHAAGCALPSLAAGRPTKFHECFINAQVCRAGCESNRSQWQFVYGRCALRTWLSTRTSTTAISIRWVEGT